MAGRRLRNAQLIGLSETHLTVQHSEGLSEVPLSDLPAGLQRRVSAPELFRQLQATRLELERLKRSCPSLDGSGVGGPSDSTGGGRETMDPPLASLPALTEGEMVTVGELLTHYRSDPAGADRRYKGKTFRLQGRIDAFDPVLLLRHYGLWLCAEDRSFRAYCRFGYPGDCQSVITRDGGQLLVARFDRGREVNLLQRSDEITIKGVCRGLRERSIHFTECRLEVEPAQGRPGFERGPALPKP